MADPPNLQLIADPSYLQLIADPPHLQLMADPTHLQLMAHPPYLPLMANLPHLQLMADPPHLQLMADSSGLPSSMSALGRNNLRWILADHLSVSCLATSCLSACCTVAKKLCKLVTGQPAVSWRLVSTLSAKSLIQRGMKILYCTEGISA